MSTVSKVDGGMKISCPLILKNEGDTVYKALESIHGFVDEYVISIDDKTTDNTREEVERFFKDYNGTPYKIMQHTWEDSFSKARNDLSRKCSNEYLFILDGHEWLENKEKMNSVKDRTDIDVFIMEVMLHTDIGDSILTQPRLFKKGYKYENAAHNVLMFDQTVDKVVKINSATIHHKRSKDLLNNRLEQRSKMNIEDLKERREKGDRTANYMLGCEYMALSVWDEAIFYFEEYLKKDSAKNERYQMMCNLAMCYYHNKDYVNAERILKDCHSINVENRNAHLVFLAELYYQVGNYFKSLYSASIATNIPKPEQFYLIYPVFYYEEPFSIMKKCYKKIGYSRGVKECNLILEKLNGNNGS